MSPEFKNKTREQRVATLIADFSLCVDTFDHDPVFSRTEQLENHLATIHRRREIAGASAACLDSKFAVLLYRTLKAWGIGQRGSKLVDLESFLFALANRADDVGSLEGWMLESPNLLIDSAISRTWSIIEKLDIVNNKNLIVSGTKTLHHLLPDLVPPMDRRYTQQFFMWENPQFQYNQKPSYRAMLQTFHQVAVAVRPSRLIGPGWRSSTTKIIDNAVVGYMMRKKNGDKLP